MAPAVGAAVVVAPPTIYFRPGRTIRWPTIRPTVKFEIACMQAWRCYLCQREFDAELSDATVDHVVPRSKGGLNRNNRLLACRPCNEKKADRLPKPCELLYLRAVNLWLAV